MTKALYTIVCTCEGGIYISQVQAESISKAIREWGKIANLSVMSIDESARDELLADVADSQEVPIEGLQSVWCDSYIIGDKHAMLHIVLTLPGEGRTTTQRRRGRTADH